MVCAELNTGPTTFSVHKFMWPFSILTTIIIIIIIIIIIMAVDVCLCLFDQFIFLLVFQ
jgi:hypothetical protein